MIINKKIGIYILLIISLFIGYYFEENSSGGAKIDFGILYPYIENLRIDLREGFDIYAKKSSNFNSLTIFQFNNKYFIKNS